MKLDITVPIQISTNIWQASLNTSLGTASVSMLWTSYITAIMRLVSLLVLPCFTIVLEPEEQQKAKNAWSHLSYAWHQVDGCKVNVLEGGQKEPNFKHSTAGQTPDVRVMETT